MCNYWSAWLIDCWQWEGLWLCICRPSGGQAPGVSMEKCEIARLFYSPFSHMYQSFLNSSAINIMFRNCMEPLNRRTHLHHRCCFLLHTERAFVWEQYRHRRWPCQYRQLYCFKLGCANNGISCPPQLSFSCQSKGCHFKTSSSLSALHPCFSTSQTCDIFFITACFSISFLLK